MVQKIPYGFLLLFSLIIIMLPSIVLSLDEYIDPFTFHSVGLAQTYSQKGRYFLYPYAESSGWQSSANEISLRFIPILFLLFLNQIAGFSFWNLLFLPILGFIFPLFAYLICKNLLRSPVVAILYAVSISYGFFMFNVFYITVGQLFFLVFILIFTYILKSFEFGQSKKTNVGLLLFIFIITYFTYYTAEFLALSYLFGAFFWSLFSEKIFGIKAPKVKLCSLLLSFLVIFTGLDRIFYLFLERMSIEKALSLFGSYVNYVLHFLGTGEKAVSEYRPHIGNPLIVYVDFIQQIIIWISLIIYLLHFIRIRIVKKDQAVLTTEGLILLAFFSAGLSETLAYLPMGYGVNTRNMSLFSLLAALFILNKLNTAFHQRRKKNLVVIFMIIMLLITSANVAKFVIRINDPLNPNGAGLHSKMKVAVSWITSHTKNGVVVADLRIIGQLFFEITKEGKTDSIQLRRMGPEVHYLYSFNDEAPYKIFREKNTLLIFSYEFKERAFIAGEEWRVSPPLKENFSSLNYYTSINKIFDDGRGLIYNYS